MRSGKNLTKSEQLKRKKLVHLLLRLLVQIFYFIVMPGAFVAGFTGVKYLFNCLSLGNVIELNGFLQSLTGLVLFTIVFGRFFCGYVCAFGMTGDVIHAISSFVQIKVFKKKKVFRFSERLAGCLQKLKYLNLFVIITMCTFGIYGSLSGTSIWDVFSRLARGQVAPAGYEVGILLLAVTAVGMALEERFFCQFLCPMGALFALLPIVPFSSLKRNESNCAKSCKICLNTCPSHLKIYNDGKRIGECISCGKCQAACPKGNLSLGIRGIYRKEVIGVLLKAAVFFIMGTALGF